MYIISLFFHTCRQELDGIIAKKEDKFPPPFQVLLGLEWDLSEVPSSPGAKVSWQNLPHAPCSPLPAFSSVLEQDEIMKQFGEEIMHVHVHACTCIYPYLYLYVYVCVYIVHVHVCTCICTADLDETLVASQQPNVAFYPRHSLKQSQQQQQQQQGQHHQHQEQPGEGEGQGGTGSGAGGGQGRSGGEGQMAAPPPSAKAFFSQLDWQAEGSGYTAFADESESESESSSSEEDEEMFTHHGKADRQAQLNHNHMVCSLPSLCPGLSCTCRRGPELKLLCCIC